MKVSLVGNYLGSITRSIKDKESGEIRLLNYIRLLVGSDVVDIYIPPSVPFYDGHKVMDEIVLNVDVRAKDNKLMFRLSGDSL